jgi:ABC-type iron transport system FetAB ATPase subunit
MPPVPSTADLRSKLDRVTGLRDGLKARLDSTQKGIAKLEAEELILVQVTAFIQKLIDQEVTLGVQAVEKLQTEGLQTIFPDQDLCVRSEVDIQRGKVSVELITVQRNKDGSEIEGGAAESFGGAVTTIQSVLLRVIIMLRRGLRPLLLLDETLPAINHEYRNNTGKFLSVLCSRLNMDILMVTHDPALAEAADHAYKLVKRHGAGAKVEKVR